MPVRPLASALIGFLALCLGLAGCDKCGNPIQINAPKVASACYGPSPMQ